MKSRRVWCFVILLTTGFVTTDTFALQKFFVDFDSTLSLMDGDPAKPKLEWQYPYSVTGQRDSIIDYLNDRFMGYGLEFESGLPTIPGAGSVIQLNSAGFGGGSEGVDFRNIDDDDSAKFNALSILEFLGEDLSMPTYSVDDFSFATANIIAHEALHLMGVRHHDAHGPIGTGIGAGTAAADFSPPHIGPIAAPETGFSFAAVHAGGANFSLPGLYTPNFVSERTLVKLEVIATPFTSTEAGGSTFTTPEELDLIEFTVPYPVRPEVIPDPGDPPPPSPPLGISGKAAVVIGSLDGTPDFYTFSGTAGEKFTFEAMSYLLPADGAGGFRYADNADVAIAISDPTGTFVTANDDDDDTPPFGDSEFLGGASIIDLALPLTGTYTVEVLIAGDAFPVPGSGKTTPDPGSYELLVYSANQIVPEPTVSRFPILLLIGIMLRRSRRQAMHR